MDRETASRSADELAETARNLWLAYCEARDGVRVGGPSLGERLDLFDQTVQAYRIARAQAGLDPNVGPFEV